MKICIFNWLMSEFSLFYARSIDKLFYSVLLICNKRESRGIYNVEYGIYIIESEKAKQNVRI